MKIDDLTQQEKRAALLALSGGALAFGVGKALMEWFGSEEEEGAPIGEGALKETKKFLWYATKGRKVMSKKVATRGIKVLRQPGEAAKGLLRWIS